MSPQPSDGGDGRIADAIRMVTTAMQLELDSCRRSSRLDAHDLIEVFLAIADELDPPLAPSTAEPNRRS